MIRRSKPPSKRTLRDEQPPGHRDEDANKGKGVAGLPGEVVSHPSVTGIVGSPLREAIR